MDTNGFLVSPRFAKSIIVVVFSIGVWVSTIQADINDKAENIDVVEQQAAMTQILVRIDEKLDDLQDSVDDLDTRQREISKDVAALKADSE